MKKMKHFNRKIFHNQPQNIGSLLLGLESFNFTRSVERLGAFTAKVLCFPDFCYMANPYVSQFKNLVAKKELKLQHDGFYISTSREANGGEEFLNVDRHKGE